MEGYLQALPGIQAEESMSHVTETAIGSGTMEKADQREIMGEWREKAFGDRGRPRRERMSPEQAKIVLASMGIGVKEWPSAN